MVVMVVVVVVVMVVVVVVVVGYCDGRDAQSTEKCVFYSPRTKNDFFSYSVRLLPPPPLHIGLSRSRYCTVKKDFWTNLRIFSEFRLGNPVMVVRFDVVAMVGRLDRVAVMVITLASL